MSENAWKAFAAQSVFSKLSNRCRKLWRGMKLGLGAFFEKHSSLNKMKKSTSSPAVERIQRQIPIGDGSSTFFSI